MNERPWSSGKFLISAGLRPLEDRPVFLPENNLSTYLDNKKIVRRENSLKHYPLPVGLSSEEMKSIALTLKERLKKDLPTYRLDPQFQGRDEIDFIISQVPEDFAIWKLEDDKEWLALIHLSSSNHWDAREKIGRSFTESHQPIPRIDPISRAAPKLFEQIQKRGAVERFAWGVATDDRLNHHPEPPVDISLEEWRGRSFDEKAPKLYARIERQTLFPVSKTCLGFTIKTYFQDISTLPTKDIQLIAQSIAGMDDRVLHYKGLYHDKDAILSWLSILNTESFHSQSFVHPELI